MHGSNCLVQLPHNLVSIGEDLHRSKQGARQEVKHLLLLMLTRFDALKSLFEVILGPVMSDLTHVSAVISVSMFIMRSSHPLAT